MELVDISNVTLIASAVSMFIACLLDAWCIFNDNVVKRHLDDGGLLCRIVDVLLAISNILLAISVSVYLYKVKFAI